MEEDFSVPLHSGRSTVGISSDFILSENVRSLCSNEHNAKKFSDFSDPEKKKIINLNNVPLTQPKPYSVDVVNTKFLSEVKGNLNPVAFFDYDLYLPPDERDDREEVKNRGKIELDNLREWMDLLVDVETLSKVGHEYVDILYTYRSLAKSMPYPSRETIAKQIYDDNANNLAKEDEELKSNRSYRSRTSLSRKVPLSSLDDDEEDDDENTAHTGKGKLHDEIETQINRCFKDANIKVQVAVIEVYCLEMQRLLSVAEYAKDVEKLLTVIFQKLIGENNRNENENKKNLDNKLFAEVEGNLEQQNYLIPNEIYIGVIKLIDIIQKLDSVKDIKSGIKNDFNSFARAFQYVEETLPPDNKSEIRIIIDRLRDFIAPKLLPPARSGRPWVIFQGVRSKLQSLSIEYVGVASFLIEIALDFLDDAEKGVFFTLPEEKYCVLRALPCLLWLIDRDNQGSLPGAEGGDIMDVNVFKVLKQRKSFDRVQRIIKKHPVVPQIGDVNMDVEYVLNNIPHYDANTIKVSNRNVKDIYTISEAKWSELRKSYMDVMCEFSYITTEIQVSATVIDLAMKSQSADLQDKEIVDTIARKTVKVVRQVLDLLSYWSSLFREFLAFKYSWRFSLICSDSLTWEGMCERDPSLKSLHENELSDYEKLIKFNFDKQEMSILCDLIFMIKSLTGKLQENHSLIAPLVQYHIHKDTQYLLRLDIVPVLHRVRKNNKWLYKPLLWARECAADFTNTSDNNQMWNKKDEFIKYRRKLKKVYAAQLSVSSRVAPPSSTQMILLRTILCAISHMDPPNCFGKADVYTEEKTRIEQFIAKAREYPFILNCNSVAASLSDMSELWFREYYLDFNSQLQFPIRASLPWCLTQHLLITFSTLLGNTATSSTSMSAISAAKMFCNAPLLEKIAYTLDVYNDASNQALRVMKRNFIYEEIEAEVNLAVESLLYVLAEEVYSYYKNFAASIVLNRDFKDKMDSVLLHDHVNNSKESEDINFHNFEEAKRQLKSTIDQRFLKLLGRSIDVHQITSEHIRHHLINDIDIAIRNFESKSCVQIFELYEGLKVLEFLHSLLQSEGGFGLRPWKILIREVNTADFSYKIKSKTRINIKVLDDLINNILPNYCYNIFTSRFIPSQVQMSDVTTLSSGVKNSAKEIFGKTGYEAFNKIHSLQENYVGKEHIKAIIDVLGESVWHLIPELNRHLEDLLLKINIYVKALQPGIMPRNLPNMAYGVAINFKSSKIDLKSLANVASLKKGVYQTFREFGNCMVIIQMISNLVEINSHHLMVQVSSHLFSTRLAAFESLTGSTQGNIEAKTNCNPEKDAKELSEEAGRAPCSNNNKIDYLYLESFKSMKETVDRIKKNPRSSLLEDIEIDLKNWDINRSAKIYAPNPSQPTCTLLFYVASHISSFINDSGIVETLKGEEPDNGIFEHPCENSSKFYRFWSAISFLFCCDQPKSKVDKSQFSKKDYTKSELEEARKDSEEPSDVELFGHGFMVGGAILLLLANQRKEYELYDLNSRLLKIETVEQGAVVYSRDSKRIEKIKDGDASNFTEYAKDYNAIMKMAFLQFQHQFPSLTSARFIYVAPPDIEIYKKEKEKISSFTPENN